MDERRSKLELEEVIKVWVLVSKDVEYLLPASLLVLWVLREAVHNPAEGMGGRIVARKQERVHLRTDLLQCQCRLPVLIACQQANVQEVKQRTPRRPAMQPAKKYACE